MGGQDQPADWESDQLPSEDAVARRDVDAETSRSPAEETDSLRSRVEHLEVFSSRLYWQGQLPHPTDLREYENIVPGAAKQLIDRVVRQSEHREEMERAVTRSNIDNSRRAQYFTLIIELAALAVCFLAVLKGYPIEGLAAAFASLALLASVFTYGNERRISELQRKFREVARQEPAPPSTRSEDNQG